jgi:aconitase B
VPRFRVPGGSGIIALGAFMGVFRFPSPESIPVNPVFTLIDE